MAERKPATKASTTKKAVKKPVVKKEVAPKVETKPQALVLMQNRRGDKMNVPSSKVGEYKDQGYTEV